MRLLALCNLGWGVDGLGRSHLTVNGRDVILCSLNCSGVCLMYYYLENING